MKTDIIYRKKRYFIYQITNNINGKIYIGKHETYDIDDNYFGSGKHLKNAQKKYGLENFTKTILFELQNEEEMNLLEKMVVNENFLKRDDVYNLNEGGDGGWKYVKSRGAVKGGINVQKKNKETGFNPFLLFWNSLTDLEKEQYKKDHPIPKKFRCDWTGRHHSEETKAKMRVSRYDGHGKNNSQFGTMWICNDLTKENKKILKTDPIPDGWRKGRFYK